MIRQGIQSGGAPAQRGLRCPRYYSRNRKEGKSRASTTRLRWHKKEGNATPRSPPPFTQIMASQDYDLQKLIFQTRTPRPAYAIRHTQCSIRTGASSNDAKWSLQLSFSSPQQCFYDCVPGNCRYAMPRRGASGEDTSTCHTSAQPPASQIQATGRGKRDNHGLPRVIAIRRRPASRCVPPKPPSPAWTLPPACAVWHRSRSVPS